MVRPDGTIHLRHGYDAVTGYYHWSPGDRVPAIPRNPTLEERNTAGEIIHARRRLPFETPADRANA